MVSINIWRRRKPSVWLLFFESVRYLDLHMITCVQACILSVHINRFFFVEGIILRFIYNIKFGNFTVDTQNSDSVVRTTYGAFSLPSDVWSASDGTLGPYPPEME